MLRNSVSFSSKLLTSSHPNSKLTFLFSSISTTYYGIKRSLSHSQFYSTTATSPSSFPDSPASPLLPPQSMRLRWLLSRFRGLGMWWTWLAITDGVIKSSPRLTSVSGRVRVVVRLQPRNAEELAESVLDGYNGTVMAYSQTGTGKIYTLGRLGEEDTADRGIMVAMEDILAN